MRVVLGVAGCASGVKPSGWAAAAVANRGAVIAEAPRAVIASLRERNLSVMFFFPSGFLIGRCEMSSKVVGDQGRLGISPGRPSSPHILDRRYPCRVGLAQRHRS